MEPNRLAVHNQIAWRRADIEVCIHLTSESAEVAFTFTYAILSRVPFISTWNLRFQFHSTSR